MCMVGGQAQVLHVCGRGHRGAAPGRVGVDGCKVMGGGWLGAAWGASGPEMPY